jgi:hypothetical protein
MNLPVNTPLVENVFLEQLMPDKLFEDLSKKKFSGYTYLAAEGKYYFEEGILIFSSGNIIGSMYIIDGYGLQLFGADAFWKCIEEFGLKNGILNIYGLTDDQIKLVLIFNEKIKFDYKLDKSGLSKLGFKYNEADMDELLKNNSKTEISRKDLFKNLGLKELLAEK